MKNSDKATPRPWFNMIGIDPLQPISRHNIYEKLSDGCRGELIARDVSIKNARIIVKAVNHHEELVSLIKKIVEVNERNGVLSFGIIEECEQVLSKLDQEG